MDFVFVEGFDESCAWCGHSTDGKAILAEDRFYCSSTCLERMEELIGRDPEYLTTLPYRHSLETPPIGAVCEECQTPLPLPGKDKHYMIQKRESEGELPEPPTWLCSPGCVLSNRYDLKSDIS